MTEKQALRLGRRVVRYTLASRKGETFPLTAGWIQRVSRRIGNPIGRDRAYAVQHALRNAGEITEAGSYPHRRGGLFTGFKVKLWRPTARLRHRSFSVPAQAAWWQHPLFGFGLTSYPEGLPRRLRRWHEPPDWKIPWLHEGRCR